MGRPVYRETRVRQSELLQLLLLDALYAQKGSEGIIFQGGTALRWVYNGQRFSEDLDFVTELELYEIERILTKTAAVAEKSGTAQFGMGAAEFTIRPHRQNACKGLFVYRPESQRERIAVKLELELLKAGRQPETERHVLRDLPQVAGLIRQGDLVLPYASSLIIAETLDEILSDKIRALFERTYIKGRDIYDIWWLVAQVGVTSDWGRTKNKLSMYRTRFKSARPAGHFMNERAEKEVREAIESDLPRFLPAGIYADCQRKAFQPLLATLKQLTRALFDQGMSDESLADST
jgi:predicted nucleotidyltransferase component of viral defense system